MNHTELADAFKLACMAELEALKPGNVHVFADGHGLTVEDFVKSAEAASQIIAQPQLTLGARILEAVKATQDAVRTNTNLGIILLCAPIVQAALKQNRDTLQVNIHAVLGDTTLQDAEDCFAAIRLANPAGLGKSAQHDVHQAADCTLLEAMQEAADRETPKDMIARQYANHFADIFMALEVYRTAKQRWQRPAWAVTALYLHFLSEFLDSHIVRKHGEKIAKLVQAEAKEHLQSMRQCFNPKNYMKPLLDFDTSLKARGLNPGASADLTVATLLLHALISH